MQRAGYRVTKRCLDIAVGAVGLVVLAPLFLVIAAAIRLESPGPVLFRQRRCGRDGRDFSMVKFRTMDIDAEARKHELADRNEVSGPMFKIEKDPRATRVGALLRKTSLDELPQLWNVLRGEMSLVGPRPLAMDEMDWSPKWRDLRLKVKPGMTGLWQVEGRHVAGFEPWIEHDIAYVRNRSLRLDLRILLKTLTALAS
jgi:lipopolysaccharide/colanic/teichoic acid biosynthesis glycosyltransferase